jgi:hypothetical protein
MVLRWVAASAEVNRKPDEGVTGSVHFFLGTLGNRLGSGFSLSLV